MSRTVVVVQVILGSGGTPSRTRMTAALERWDTSGDRRSMFLHRWAQITDRLLRAVRNERFNDSQWTLQLLEQLSAYYFITVEPDGDDLTLVTPPAWQVAHQATVSSRLPQHTVVMLGVNALISNDMPQALCDLLYDEWPLSTARLERRHQDYGILSDIVTGAFADEACMVAIWLNDVWSQALTLLTAADNAWRDVIRGALEDTALRRSHLVVCDIDHREHLLELPASRLDQLFPPRHDSTACMLRSDVPAWGSAAATAF